jgi:hypothetical protein
MLLPLKVLLRDYDTIVAYFQGLQQGLMNNNHPAILPLDCLSGLGFANQPQREGCGIFQKDSHQKKESWIPTRWVHCSLMKLVGI